MSLSLMASASTISAYVTSACRAHERNMWHVPAFGLGVDTDLDACSMRKVVFLGLILCTKACEVNQQLVAVAKSNIELFKYTVLEHVESSAEMINLCNSGHCELWRLKIEVEGHRRTSAETGVNIDR